MLKIRMAHDAGPHEPPELRFVLVGRLALDLDERQADILQSALHC